MVEITRTDKTWKEVGLSTLMTFCAVYIVGALVAIALSIPSTPAVIGTVMLTALAGAVIDIEVSY